MKKILLLIILITSFLAGFSQTGNDTTKYTYYKNTYGEKFNRVWALNVLDIPNDTTYSKYGVAKKGTIVYVGNGIKWTPVNPAGGNFGTVYDSVATADRYFGLHGWNFYIHNVYAPGAPSHIKFENLETLGGGSGGEQDWVDIDQGVDIHAGSTVFANNTGINLNYLNINFTSTSGGFIWNGLIKTNDSTYKPLAVNNSTGAMVQLDHWPGGGGGGGGSATIQTITSGTSGTVTGSNYWVFFNPSSTLASYASTLPASPTIGQSVVYYFGGTITSGTVITSFTVLPNTSQAIIDNTPISGTSVTTDNTIQYDYIATNIWKRKKL